MEEIELINPSILELTLKEVSKMPQVDCPLTHIFSRGLYIRLRTAVAGTLFVGKRHRHETLSILLSGQLNIYIDNTGETEHKIGPCIWKTPAGTRRMTYSVIDNTLATIHPTNETDIDKLEEELIIPEKEYQLSLKQGD